MIKIISNKATSEELKLVALDFQGYVKVVVDIERKILSAGGKRHFEGEELLLKNGSTQEDLWGGGIDLETGDVDYDSMINIRPNDGNTGREVLDIKIRQKMDSIIKKLLL